MKKLEKGTSEIKKFVIQENIIIDNILLEKGDVIYLFNEGTKPSGFATIEVSFGGEFGRTVDNGGRFIERADKQALQWEDGASHSKTTDYNGYWQLVGNKLKLILKNQPDQYDLKHFNDLIINSLGSRAPISIIGMGVEEAKTMAKNMNKMGMKAGEIRQKLIAKGFPMTVINTLFSQSK